MIKYPTKTLPFGSFLGSYDNDISVIEEMKRLLKEQFELTKKELECEGDKVFCKIHDFEFIVKEKSGNPLAPKYTIISWKCNATGRAFYMNRLSRYVKTYKRHPNKKCVPKGKRGKPNRKKLLSVELVKKR